MSPKINSLTIAQLVKRITELEKDEAIQIANNTDKLELIHITAEVQGKTKEAKILEAAVELGKRSIKQKLKKEENTEPQDFANYIYTTWGNPSQENMGIVALNARQRIIGTSIVTTGTSTKCITSPKDVFRKAMLDNADMIIMFHNHPSGEADPSKQDIRTHEMYKQMGKLLDMPVIDHIIIGTGQCYSIETQQKIEISENIDEDCWTLPNE